jgi:4-alpha-glucanotransferase
VFPRASGILLHPTSLPGPDGIGELGEEAFRFVDFLEEAGQRVWQVLPLGPAGYGDSPYQLFSAFAGNPLLIGLDALREEGLLEARDLAGAPRFPEESVDYGAVIAFKEPLLRRASGTFRHEADAASRHAFEDFCTRHTAWLEDYARFTALKQIYGGEGDWTQWKPRVVPAEVLQPRIEEAKFLQYVFFRQWGAVREYCRERGIRVMGDVPI